MLAPLSVWGEEALAVEAIGVHPVVDQAVVPWVKTTDVKPLVRPNPKLPGKPLERKLKPEASETEISS
jgi:hypothetical protein